MLRVIIITVILYIFLSYKKNFKNKEKFEDTVSVTVCIPCIPRDINKLPKTLQSINNQTFLPLEVIIGLSETSNIYAKHLENKLNNYNYPVKIINTPYKSYAGPNRNRAAKHSNGVLISFMDADDIMHYQKLEIMVKIYKLYKPKCIVHDYTADIKNFNKEYNKIIIFKGKKIFDLANREKEHIRTNNWITKKHIIHNWININKNKRWKNKIHHGHPTIHRSVLNNIKYGKKPRGQDAVFLRNLLKHYKRNNDTIIWIDSHLSYYIPAINQN